MLTDADVGVVGESVAPLSYFVALSGKGLTIESFGGPCKVVEGSISLVLNGHVVLSATIDAMGSTFESPIPLDKGKISRVRVRAQWENKSLRSFEEPIHMRL